MAEQNNVIAIDSAQKRTVKKKRHVGNPAMTGDAIDISQSDQAALVSQALTIANWPNIDLHDPAQVQQRINDYFTLVTNNGNRPTVAGLGLALNNMPRQTLWEIRTGTYRRDKEPYNLPRESSDFIKKAYKIMEELWENYMQTGRINPVSGIFLGKNHYGYQDRQEVVVTPNNPEQDYNASDIAKRYIEAEPIDDEQ